MFHDIFWGAVVAGAMIWIGWVGWGFPQTIRLLAKVRGRRTHPKAVKLPKVSFLVPCRNEEAFVTAKAANLRQIGSHLESWEALMIDDASTDKTAEMLGSIEGAGISVIRTPGRSGKIRALRLAAKHTQGEILVITDCGCRLDPNSIRPMLDWFADEKVGLVTGCYRTIAQAKDSRAKGEGEYWSREMELRAAECDLGSTTHATGALLAVRKDLFENVEWPEGTINDDIHLPLRILEQGYDVVCEPKAVATENVETDISGEFRRRVRIATGNFQMVREIPRLFRARRWFPIFQLVSHKLMRNALVVPMFSLLAACGALGSEVVFRIGFLAQIALYGTIGFGILSGKISKWPTPMISAAYALLAILASSVGMWRWLRGWRPVSWERTDRLAQVRNA